MQFCAICLLETDSPQWPEPTERRRPILHSILREGTYRSAHEAETRVQNGLLAFTNEAAVVRETYFRKLDHFSKHAATATEDENKTKRKAVTIPDDDDYPTHVNSTLYSALQSHSICTCASSHGPKRARHYGRLRLRSETIKVDGCIAFDMLLSSNPDTWGHWQDLQMRVSL